MKIPNEFGMFRGVTIKGDEIVYGYLFKASYHNHIGYFIQKGEYAYKNGSIYGDEVYPLSLAACTLLKDKNNTPIYGSFPLPDGTMTKGGDIVEADGFINRKIEYYNYAFRANRIFLLTELRNIYIISSQWDEVKS